MMFDTKVAVVVREDLAVWQKLNVTAFLMSGVATSAQDLVGDPYEDGSGRRYLPMLRQPILVFAASADQLRHAYERAVEFGLQFAIYTDDLFKTGFDEANRAAVRAVGSQSLVLAGIAMRAEKKLVDKALKRLKLHA